MTDRAGKANEMAYYLESVAHDNALLICVVRQNLPDIIAILRSSAKVREALLPMSKMAEGYRDTGWNGYDDGYAAARIEAAEFARRALASILGDDEKAVAQ